MTSSQTTLTLADFLLDRIAEDERRVYASDSDGEYRVAWVTFRRRDGSLDYTTVAADHRNGYWTAGGSAYQSEPGRVEISEPVFDAARVLAECKAKRRIVELHQDGNGELIAATREWDPEHGLGSYCVRCTVEHDGEPWPCETLRLLALPYADHPDYRQEWRP